MAKFDALHPDAKQLDKVEFDGSFLVRDYDDMETLECWVCGHKTKWVDGILMTALCSEECERVAWSDYYKALADSA